MEGDLEKPDPAGPDSAYIVDVNAGEYTNVYVIPVAALSSTEQEMFALANGVSRPSGVIDEATPQLIAVVELCARLGEDDALMDTVDTSHELEEENVRGLPTREALAKVNGAWSRYLALSFDMELLKMETRHIERFEGRPVLGAVIPPNEDNEE